MPYGSYLNDMFKEWQDAGIVSSAIRESGRALPKFYAVGIAGHLLIAIRASNQTSAPKGISNDSRQVGRAPAILAQSACADEVARRFESLKPEHAAPRSNLDLGAQPTLPPMPPNKSSRPRRRVVPHAPRRRLRVHGVAVQP